LAGGPRETLVQGLFAHFRDYLLTLYHKSDIPPPSQTTSASEASDDDNNEYAPGHMPVPDVEALAWDIQNRASLATCQSMTTPWAIERAERARQQQGEGGDRRWGGGQGRVGGDAIIGSVGSF